MELEDIYYSCVYISLPVDPILGPVNPIRTLTLCFLNIKLILILRVSSGLLLVEPLKYSLVVILDQYESVSSFVIKILFDW
jgi:hypothetical protein